MNIGLDLDGVLLNIEKMTYNVAKKYGLNEYAKDWNFNNYSEDIKKEIFSNFKNPEIMGNLKPFNGIKTKIKKLKNNNNLHIKLSDQCSMWKTILNLLWLILRKILMPLNH